MAEDAVMYTQVFAMENTMKNTYQTTQKGFTLVELSIVLVIIGLIISSVLVGQDLVRAAELRATVTQYEQFNSAVATFRGKYSGLPGDVAGNTNFGFVGNGNGDNVLAATGVAGHAAGENVYFWNHLGSSGAALISGSYDGAAITTTAGDINTATPRAKAGENWGVFAAGGINYFILGATNPGTNSYQTTAAMLTALDARSLDEKIDDGRPIRGVVRAKGAHASSADTDPTYDQGSNAEACTGGAAADLATEGATATYNTAFTGLNCTLRLRFNL